ncbi:MAG: hypothetical protein LBJ00_10475 [Planctomycetaceae bacterium]|nr:hypothetical protein [Planctomycetaceae bacterium]
MNNRFTLLRLPNALRCRFTVASGILKQLGYKFTNHIYQQASYYVSESPKFIV